MQKSRENQYIIILYLIPYIIGDYIITYYFDYIAKQYPHFFPPAFFILIMFPIYIGLGYICGLKKQSNLCIIGTILHLCICKICICFLLPLINIKNGVAEVWFPIWTIFIIICQLIGYWGAKS